MHSAPHVALALRKATFTSPSVSLALALHAIGMSQAFDATNSDFPGMCANPPDGLNLYITDVWMRSSDNAASRPHRARAGSL
jgi:hypothetical protein